GGRRSCRKTRPRRRRSRWCWSQRARSTSSGSAPAGRRIPGRAGEGGSMLNWVLDLDIVWMVLVVSAATALITAGIWALVIWLASGGRAATLKGFSPGMLPPMGLVFGLLVGF